MTLSVSATDQASGSNMYHDATGSPLFVNDRDNGEKLYTSKGCVECHGPRGYSVDVNMVPKIAGMDRQYVIDQLLAFQSGKRQNVIMSPVAATLTSDDILALATFVSSVH